jgi:hypothetical protein
LRKTELAYGFCSNPSKSTHHNAFLHFLSMPTWFYFNRPTNLAFHNLTSTLKQPQNLKSLLGLSLKFIPMPRQTTSWSSLGNNDPLRPHGFRRLHRDLHLLCHFAGAPDNNDEYNPRMHLKSNYMPPPWTYPQDVARREENFKLCLKGLFKRRPGKTCSMWNSNVRRANQD